MAEMTAEERAIALGEEVDFQKRSKEFGEQLDILIEKYQVGLTVQMCAKNFNVQGNVLIFNTIEPYIARINLKNMPKATENGTKETKAKGKKKGK